MPTVGLLESATALEYDAFSWGHLVLTIKGDCRERVVEVAERLRMNAYWKTIANLNNYASLQSSRLAL